MVKSITTSEQVQAFVDARQLFIDFEVEVVTSVELKNRWSHQKLTLPASEKDLERVLEFIETTTKDFVEKMRLQKKARQESGGDKGW
jgi:hypothetical protein